MSELLGTTREVVDRRLQILSDLQWYNERYPEYHKGGALPMDIGASDASHHSGDLKFMVNKGLVRKEGRYIGIGCILRERPASFRYWITKKGKEHLKLKGHRRVKSESD